MSIKHINIILYSRKVLRALLTIYFNLIINKQFYVSIKIINKLQSFRQILDY